MNQSDTALAVQPVSFSRFSTWLYCPRRYLYRYILESPEERASGNFVFGSAIHEAFEAFMRSLKDDPLSHEAVVAVFERAMHDEIALNQQHGVPIDWGKKSAEEMLAKGTELIDVFLQKVDRNVTVIGTEVPFEVQLADDIVINGVIDLLLDEGDGRYRVVDLKTSASSLSLDRLEFDLQPTVYLLAAERILAAPGKVDFEFWVLTKAKTPAFRIYPLQRSQSQRAEVIEVIRDVRAAEAAGIFPRQRSYMCFGCEHRDKCDGEVR